MRALISCCMLAADMVGSRGGTCSCRGGGCLRGNPGGIWGRPAEEPGSSADQYASCCTLCIGVVSVFPGCVCETFCTGKHMMWKLGQPLQRGWMTFVPARGAGIRLGVLVLLRTFRSYQWVVGVRQCALGKLMGLHRARCLLLSTICLCFRDADVWLSSRMCWNICESHHEFMKE